MEVADLISRFESNRHSVRGTAFASHLPFRETPFHGTFLMLRTDSSLNIEGSAQPEGEEPIGFEIIVPFGAIQLRGAKVELRSGPTGLATGRIVTTGPGFELLARSLSGACSGHLEFTGTRTFAMSGMLEFQSHCLAFAAKDADTWREAQAAKVYSLPSRR